MVSLATLSPSDRRQIQEVYELAQALFQSELQAMYLYGSAALGGLHPQSDIDLLLVLRGGAFRRSQKSTHAGAACLFRPGGRYLPAATGSNSRCDLRDLPAAFSASLRVFIWGMAAPRDRSRAISAGP